MLTFFLLLVFALRLCGKEVLAAVLDVVGHFLNIARAGQCPTLPRASSMSP